MPSAAVLAKKTEYDARVCGLLESYDRAFLCAADNVTSKQFMNMRAGLREKGSQILMGKNTLMKRCIRKYIERTGDQKWAELPGMMVGNVGILFVKGELMEVRDIIDEFKVGAPAKMGVLAQFDVTIPAGPSGLDPSQTSFFQALNIPTKIVKGSIEITADVKVCTEGEKVSASAATLLGKLNIKPFAYNLGLVTVFDNGSVYDTKVLDITDEDIQEKFMMGVRNIAALSLAAGYPTMASVPHSFINGYKKVLAIALTTDYVFEQAAALKALLDDPEAMAAAMAAAAKASGGGGGGGGAAEPEPEEEEEEEEEEMEFDLFD